MKIAELLMRETLPRKSFFKASEVSSLLKVQPYEIRYWESEFPKLRSQKNKVGKRFYQREDVVLISAIRHLLKDKKLTLEGAKKVIADMDYVFAPVSNTDQVPVEVFEKCSSVEEAPNSLWAQVNHETVIDHDQILGEVSDILDEEDDFDELAHKIYQHCGEDLKQAVKETDSLVADNQGAAPTISPKRCLNAKEEQALASLVESKERLNDILRTLDRYKDLGFWQDFNA